MDFKSTSYAQQLLNSGAPAGNVPAITVPASGGPPYTSPIFDVRAYQQILLLYSCTGNPASYVQVVWCDSSGTQLAYYTYQFQVATPNGHQIPLNVLGPFVKFVIQGFAAGVQNASITLYGFGNQTTFKQSPQTVLQADSIALAANASISVYPSTLPYTPGRFMFWITVNQNCTVRIARVNANGAWDILIQIYRTGSVPGTSNTELFEAQLPADDWRVDFVNGSTAAIGYVTATGPF